MFVARLCTSSRQFAAHCLYSLVMLHRSFSLFCILEMYVDFTWDPAVPCAALDFCSSRSQCFTQTCSSPAVSTGAMSKRLAFLREAISFQEQRPSSEGDDDEWARMPLNSDGFNPLISLTIRNVVGDLLMEFMETRNFLRVSETCLSAVRLNLV